MDKLKSTFSSTLDSLIEKFRTETNRQSEEDFRNTRRLTTEAPHKPQNEEPSHDIDRQITDLESLIKRLQNEIIDMTTEVDKPVEEGDLRQWFTKPHYDFQDNEEDLDTDKPNSHIYPILIPNSGPVIKDRQSYDDTIDISGLIDSASTSDLAENFSAIRRNFSLLWDDVIENEIVTEMGENIKQSDTSDTFAEVRAEIMEKITNQDNGMPLNNSKEDMIKNFQRRDIT